MKKQILALLIGVNYFGVTNPATKIHGKSMRAFIGFVDLIEGAEALLRDNNADCIEAVHNLMEGVSSLVETSIHGLDLDFEQQIGIARMVDEFKNQIYALVQDHQFRSAVGANDNNPNNSFSERDKLKEGLSLILYNVVCILIDPRSIGTCLTSILSGIYKVVSAMLSDGKIDRNDWNQLLKALASIFSLSKTVHISTRLAN